MTGALKPNYTGLAAVDPLQHECYAATKEVGRERDKDRGLGLLCLYWT